MRVPAFRRLTGRFAALLVALGSALLITQPVVQTQTADALPFAKGFLVTGDYAVGSVELTPGNSSGGFVNGTIPMSGVPANADVISAFLYWETISNNPSQVDFPQFRGAPITVAKASSAPLTSSFSQCWANSGATMTMYRADVLRLLPIQKDAQGKPTGRVLVNNADLIANGEGLNTVRLPDAGSGNNVPSTAGATLFVVYRTPTDPLRHISLYDGIAIQPQGATTTQTLRGVLQMAPGATARLTHIAATGAKNQKDRLYFNDTLIANDPFPGGGPSSDRTWSTLTFDVTSLMGGRTNSTEYGEQVTTRVDHTNSSPYECLAWSAIIFSTAVQDTDQDGLPDRLEDQSGLKRPDGKPLPDLHAMGAASGHKDLFIEIGAMQADPGTTYGGSTVDPVGHNHLPRPSVLKQIGDAYKYAPVANAVGGSGITVHFDVGPDYHLQGADYLSTDADEYLVPAYLARGGELIKEADCAVSVPGCAFPGYPGTVSWKVGYQLLRDAPVGVLGQELSAAEMDVCDAADNCARRRFDQERMNFFRYGLYAHYRGKPKDLCQTGTAEERATCRQGPNFRIPSTASGVADLPGGDFMVTTGAWGNGFVGSDFVNASTTMHELGHTLWRTHGGNALTVAEPNCKPNYLSVMNYLFQLHGLRDEDGTPHLDYSRTIDGAINENTLFNDPANPVALQYRTAWYAPLLPGTLPATLGTPAATRFCNGAVFPNPLPADWKPMARVDFYSATLGAIDWSAGLHAGPPQDVNFDGQLSGSLSGADDWTNLRLNQVGSRRNMAGFSNGIEFEFGIDFTGGPDFTGGLDFEFGIDFTGGVDYSWGIDFTGGVDYEFGIDFTGGVDLEYGIDFTGGVESSGGAEMDILLASALGNTPANNFKACVIGTGGCAQGADPLHRVRLTWKKPDVGNVTSYSVFRVAGHTVTPASEITLVGGASVPGTALALVDPAELPDNQPFTYYIRAVFDDGKMSVSNFSKIIAVNDAPVAQDSTIVTNEDTPALKTLGATDVDSTDPLVFSLVAGPSHGTLSGTLPNVTYTPYLNYFGTDSFTFKANDRKPPINPDGRDSNVATVSVTVNPVNDAPSFTKGANQTVNAGSGPKTVSGWATSISPGPANSTPASEPPASESGQALNFLIVSNSNPAVFAAAPAISPAGVLTYTPSTTAGTATIGVQIHDSGGTAFGGIDTSATQFFSITVGGAAPPSVTMTSAGPADVWLGLKDSADQGAKFDVKAEVLKNGVVVASGQVNGVTMGTASTVFNSSKAVLKEMGLSPASLTVPLGAGDTLSLRMSVRIASSGFTKTKATAILWYNQAGSGDDSSHLHARVGGVDRRYSLVPGFVLTTASTGGTPQSVSVLVDRAVNGNAFVTFGTWTILIQ